MDPITAIATAIAKAFEFGIVVVEGQPPEFKALAWKQWGEIVQRLLDLGKPNKES